MQRIKNIICGGFLTALRRNADKRQCKICILPNVLGETISSRWTNISKTTLSHISSNISKKTGERIVYSKGLPQFFISDIMDDDIVCPIGVEDKKLLLFDNFVCWDEGEYIGEVSADVIKQMRKCN